MLADQIQEFIDRTFLPEKIELINKAFELFYLFNLKDSETDFVNLVTRDNYIDVNELQDTFVTLLNNKLDQLIEAHTITLIETDDIGFKVELLNALFMIMYLEDYSFISIILETELTELEKLSKIISEYSLLDEISVIANIIKVSSDFFIKLETYVNSKENVIVEPIEATEDTIDNIKLAIKCFGSENILAADLLRNNIRPCCELSIYLNVLKDIYDFNNIKDHDKLALDVFSLLLLTRSGLNGVLLLYRKNSNLLFTDINTITIIENKIISLINKFLDFKKILKEAKK